jgi:hypothetical protein
MFRSRAGLAHEYPGDAADLSIRRAYEDTGTPGVS